MALHFRERHSYDYSLRLSGLARGRHIKSWQLCVLFLRIGITGVVVNLYTGFIIMGVRMNKLIMGLILSLVAISAIGAKPETAQQNPFVPKDMKTVDVPLTSASIQKVLASFSALREEFKDYQPTGDAQDMQNYMQANSAAFKKGESIVREAGFKDWPDWYGNFAKVMQTYMAYKMNEEGRINQAQMQQQLQAMQDAPGLTAEQKQMMGNAMGMTNMYMQMAENVPEADLKTIRPYAGQLEMVLQSGDK
jgi:hypothetical protein